MRPRKLASTPSPTSPPPRRFRSLAGLTRWVLAHKRTVVDHLDRLDDRRHRGRRARLRCARAGVLGARQGGLGDQRRIAERYGGTGGDTRPAASGRDPARGPDGRLARRYAPTWRSSTPRSSEALPGARIASYASTGDARSSPTTAAPPSRSSIPQPDPDSAVRREPRRRAGRQRGARGRDGRGRAGAPDRLRRARRGQRRRQRGPRRAARGGASAALGALVVLTFVFASFLASSRS